ncbi:hypothetical protein CEXT_447531 [Caerostris extrusa]|uniref:Uncharacterized protein n=1 Tax=Caerostris extrusa TaxID=172846 RepID=A0AAV4N3E5_CAEEX|nr:hypothetical protein CEXT_447531 [Caerostris extrusa]
MAKENLVLRLLWEGGKDQATAMHQSEIASSTTGNLTDALDNSDYRWFCLTLACLMPSTAGESPGPKSNVRSLNARPPILAKVITSTFYSHD